MSLINCLSSHGEAISAAMRAFGQLSGEYQKPGLVGGGGGFELRVVCEYSVDSGILLEVVACNHNHCATKYATNVRSAPIRSK
jgi:hypothetical protein